MGKIKKLKEFVDEANEKKFQMAKKHFIEGTRKAIEEIRQLAKKEGIDL